MRFSHLRNAISYPSKIESLYYHLSTFRHPLPFGFLYQTVFPGSWCNVRQSDPCDSSCSSQVSATGSCVVAKQLSDWLHRNRQVGKYGGRYKVDEFVDAPPASAASQKLCTVHWERTATTHVRRETTNSVIFWKARNARWFLDCCLAAFFNTLTLFMRSNRIFRADWVATTSSWASIH